MGLGQISPLGMRGLFRGINDPMGHKFDPCNPCLKVEAEVMCFKRFHFMLVKQS